MCPTLGRNGSVVRGWQGQPEDSPCKKNGKNHMEKQGSKGSDSIAIDFGVCLFFLNW